MPLMLEKIRVLRTDSVRKAREIDSGQTKRPQRKTKHARQQSNSEDDGECINANESQPCQAKNVLKNPRGVVIVVDTRGVE